ncbi:MAG: acylphosphatase [Pseudomonadota bacterium]
MEPETRSGKRLLIEGRVQGVGYRASFAAKAIELGLAGWVRNRHDGSVEACVCGDASIITRITEWAWRGPAAAKVDQITCEDVTAANTQDDTFKILPTV